MSGRCRDHDRIRKTIKKPKTSNSRKECLANTISGLHYHELIPNKCPKNISLIVGEHMDI
jgi:hypothetical protein